MPTAPVSKRSCGHRCPKLKHRHYKAGIPVGQARSGPSFGAHLFQRRPRESEDAPPTGPRSRSYTASRPDRPRRRVSCRWTPMRNTRRGHRSPALQSQLRRSLAQVNFCDHGVSPTPSADLKAQHGQRPPSGSRRTTAGRRGYPPATRPVAPRFAARLQTASSDRARRGKTP